ncbi:putative bifunctional diguanylate cyclase/phosphodiesterase [Pseudopontixanthobacter vadosimaris]|uniref:putative bifunctional diguanylate cyclase/phosphodiesterase n=1 Tax=Pseudopontixanthobacter vadosimaris TaxID=2726450 RepID=UPI001F0F1308|nr:EAL domain-containing protein [Pseudopontixanthobacter vadosimaris]
MTMHTLFSRFGRFASEHPASHDEKVAAPKALDLRGRIALMDEFENTGLRWFWATDEEGLLTYLSHNAAEQLGTDEANMLGQKLTSLFTLDYEGNIDGVQRPLGFLMSARHTIADLPVKVAIDGHEVWWRVSGKPVSDAAGEFRGYRGSAKDITALRESQIDASRLAQFDALTGLSNRHRMTKRLTSTLNAYRMAKRSCAVMMLDLDRFKQVNDTLGHPAGDELLKQVAQRLETVIRNKGEIGRPGGDEFQIMLPDIDDRGTLGEIGSRVIQMISQPYSIDGSRAIIGTSIGIAIAPYDGLETEELVSAADLALYAAKGGGRGQFRFYSSELKDGANLRRQIEEGLRDALASGTIDLHYQPLVRTANHTASGFEALMRWNHPERGWISPAQFIPVAEDTGIIGNLGEWALMRGCQDAATWPGDLRVAVNISAVQFASDDLPRIVERALQASGLAPNRLELEITESIFLGDPHATHVMFRDLKAIGVRLALDNFGTGYSSLGYLKDAPFDKIKIDQSFIRGATEQGNNNAALITAIVSLAEALDMETVAEGVESLDELSLVTDLGTSHVQGFVFASALAQAEVLSRLEEGQLAYQPVGPAKHRAGRRTLYRKVGIIHEDHRYEGVLRNLSRTGAMVEGLLDVPTGTQLVLDMGEGQLAVSTVRRSNEAVQGLEFETPLVDDGAGGLCTRHRISPYALAAAGMPLAALPSGHYPLDQAANGPAPSGRPKFLQVELSSLSNSPR